MVSTLHHRGPDGTGFYSDEDVGLAHARLSIIDLVSGDQPIHNEARTVWVVFNGEIFNYIELRQELQAAGHTFYTQSDTEVLVHLYEEYGESFVDHLNGQFAIALWDKSIQCLFLVRDRPGIAPLYYTQQNGQLLFGSEVKAILAGHGKPIQLDPIALDQLMTTWAPISPRTIFKSVWEVQPGEMVVIRRGKLSTRRYWDWPFPADGEYRRGTEEDLAEELHALLIDATKLRLRADVPVGAYLSGGLDSSVITSLIHHYGGVPLRTFSIGFEDEGLDETPFQQKMIAHLHADHSRIHCSPSDIADHFVRAIWHTESPILRTAPVPMGILSGLVHEKNYRVVLTGEGADEVLGGYDIFKEAKIRQFWAKSPESTLRPLLLKRLYPYLDVSPGRAQRYLQNFFGQGIDAPDSPCFSHLPRFDTTSKCKAFFSDALKEGLSERAEEAVTELLPKQFSRWHPFNRSQYLEVKTLMSGYLLSSQGDRMLLSHSVEGRFPFLDHRVMEFASTLHPRLKMKVLNEKYLLKKAAGHYLPSNIVARPKQPYRAPDIPAFFTSPMHAYVEDLLSEETVKRFGYFDAKKTALLVKKIQKGRAIGYKDNMSLVGILSTQVWHHHFIENFTSRLS
jgi:asparagine synthase (glutamine-hydrolysing)